MVKRGIFKTFAQSAIQDGGELIRGAVDLVEKGIAGTQKVWQSLPKRPRKVPRRSAPERAVSAARKLFKEEVVVPTQPPAPQLVGVELNPGPKMSKKLKKLAKFIGPLPRGVVRPVIQHKNKQNKQKSLVKNVGLSSISAPVSIGYKSVMSNKMRNTIVSHCEQIAEISQTTAQYQIQVALQINPGLTISFPWLSQVASNYEAYEFKKLEFYFVPYTSTAILGYNAMNFDYNPQEESSTQFPTKQSFTDYDGSVQCNAWEGFRMQVKCPNMEGGNRIRTIRTGAISGQYDLHCYDHGQFNFAVGAGSGSSTIGTLYCCYSVSLLRPRISSLGAGQATQAFGTSAYASGVSKTSMLGTVSTSITAAADSTIGAYVGTVGSLGSSGGVVLLSPSLTIPGTINNTFTYLITYSAVGVGFALSTGVNFFLNSDSAYTVVYNSPWAADEDGTQLVGWAIAMMNATNVNRFNINFGSATLAATSVASYSMNIVQIPYGLSLTTPERRFEKYMRKLIASQITESGLQQIVEKMGKLSLNDEKKEDDHSSDNESYIIPEPVLVRSSNLQNSVKENWDTKSTRSLGKVK